MYDIVPAAVRDPRIETCFVDANGLRFEVDTCGTGDRLALCLHGFPEHSFSWRYQLPLLAELGYRAWAPNLRGYGNSSRPEGVEAYDLEHLMADVAGLIDASGCQEVVLLAHDWGAVIAWHFAIRRIRPLTHLIICNVPHPGPARQALRRGLAQLKKSWYIFFFSGATTAGVAARPVGCTQRGRRVSGLGRGQVPISRRGARGLSPQRRHAGCPDGNDQLLSRPGARGRCEATAGGWLPGYRSPYADGLGRR